MTTANIRIVSLKKGYLEIEEMNAARACFFLIKESSFGMVVCGAGGCGASFEQMVIKPSIEGRSTVNLTPPV